MPLRDLESIDQVSRGPWGSLLWVLKLRRAWSMVTIGSYLTLAATAFSFFAQQFVAVDTRLAQDPSTVAYFPWVQDVGVCDDEVWARAFSDGFLGSGTDDGLIQCPADECKWTDVLSVGVCGECTDVIHEFDDPSCSERDSVMLCDYSLPGAPSSSQITLPAANTLLNQSMTEKYINASINLFWYGNTTTHPADSCDAAHISIGSFGIMEIPSARIYSYGLFKTIAPSFTRCNFNFCQQNFTVSVTNGQRNQTVTNQIITNTTDSRCIGEIPIFTHMAENPTQASRRFTISVKDVPFGAFFDALRRDQSVAHISFSANAYDDSSTRPNSAYLITELQSRQDEYWNLWTKANGTRAQWADKLAQAISTTVRRTNAVSATGNHIGATYLRQAYIKVTWSWIVYPAVLLLVTLGLFAFSIIHAQSAGQNIWITGNLALLLSDTSSDIQLRAQGAYGSHDALLEAVGNHAVRLESNGRGGWTFQAPRVQQG
ncbi:hypothetical protein SUNI508_06900 [Seiridium unicorne]|uniref:Uncharacterized protein n=1 Tax=Seiridium unicorne TaxID=138068 RepID=A0ABR2UZW4_9PEZI